MLYALIDLTENTSLALSLKKTPKIPENQQLEQETCKNIRKTPKSFPHLSV